MPRRFFKFLWVTLFVISLGMFELSAETEQKLEAEEYFRNFEEFVQVVKEIQNKYVVAEIELKELLKNAYRGMLSGLDPYSQFIDSENLEELKIETEGQFDGLGIEVVVKGGVLTVLTPIVDSPAFRAGVLIGDRIIKINGNSTKNITIREAIKMLRGKSHTTVTITVVHEGENEPTDITIERDIIHVMSIRGSRIVDEDYKVGYIAVSNFQENTVTDLDLALEDLKQQGFESLILDLRFNPGGLLNVAVEMVDMFVKKGVIVSTKGRHQSQNNEYKAHRTGTLPHFPLIILVNNGSASASEIVAGAIKDHKRGLLLGTKTYGKGSVQSLIPIAVRNSALKLTTARYYTPSGAQIDHTGIEPDVKVPLSKAEVRELYAYLSRSNAKDIRVENGQKPIEGKTDFVDLQLLRAIELLKGIKIYSKIADSN
ncbi:MAG: S41 family peptidase [Candidatus Scalindua sp. AMX11]|nr:MAG: S41 family peptidase [Candidatus Scalindua sp.]NOG85138.1 S41 family peptidase [Planctomycetota bacterium]RZV67656.1 MAG: S41 family peptidase [Candidatus Scalindua sp. SCAELEC01]TDE63708.1 MAG: S41 family peptidase [Candidatus Scalindua sp. AMX11]GJQ57211.1 MAG: peptidase S41 [Candidatus Scalindua sp.]